MPMAGEGEGRIGLASRNDTVCGRCSVSFPDVGGWEGFTSFDLDHKAALRVTTLLLQTVGDELQETVGEFVDDDDALGFASRAAVAPSRAPSRGGESCPELIPGLPYGLALQCLSRARGSQGMAGQLSSS